MADFSKIQKARRSSLGKPPAIEEASQNLQAPETAPAAPAKAHPRIDGRSARRSNRTIQFATRVTPEFDERIRAIAIREGKLLVQILEEALDAYEGKAAR
ncbi:hypothetical protein [Paraburkholderia strydomiana]|uniref:Stability/partitioning determinant n=1 Tax=Paraburkholderia strydomiana TaxID=1245417 RepID=A0ABW9CCS0_9BURK